MFSQFYSYPKRLVPANAVYGQFITNGLNADQKVNEQDPKAGMLTFTGNTNNKLAIHWSHKIKEMFLVRVMGLNKIGKPVIIGFCLPKLKDGKDWRTIYKNYGSYLDLKPAVSFQDIIPPLKFNFISNSTFRSKMTTVQVVSPEMKLILVMKETTKRMQTTE